MVPTTPVTETFAKPVIVTVPTALVPCTPFNVSKVLPIAVVPATPVTETLASPVDVEAPTAPVAGTNDSD